MYKYIFLFFFYTASICALNIDENSSNIELLKEASLYIDSTNSLTKEQVQNKVFHPLTENSLNFGIIPNSRIWIKLTLTNSTNQKLTKILEYANIKPEEVILYDGKSIFEEGLLLHHRMTLRPTFTITLSPNETKTYFIAAHSSITALIAQLTLWTVADFYIYELEEKLLLMGFFTIFFTLLLYNFIIYIFTKEQVYLFYTLYLASVIIFEIIYLGIGQIYFFPHELSIIITKATLLSVSLLVVPMILFSMKLLQSEHFKKIHLGLKFYLFSFPIISILGYDNLLFDLDILVVLFPLVFIFLAAGYFSYKKGIKEALLYLFGWGFILITLAFAVMQSLGVFNIFAYVRHTIEFAFVAEVFIFAIAIAYRLKRLSQEKVELNNTIIEIQISEQKRLEKLVAKRTSELELSVNEKEILFKELQHRVKNNLAFIVSILELQTEQISSDTSKDILTSTTNRIHSFSSMYELLLYEKSNTLLTTQLYFKKIIDYIQDEFFKHIKVELEIRYEVPSHKLIYYGLILNELITNAYKHAFNENNNCSITIKLFEDNNILYFIVKDNGNGYVDNDSISLGKTIVETLVKKQLQGEMKIKSSNLGTEITILIHQGKKY